MKAILVSNICRIRSGQFWDGIWLFMFVVRSWRGPTRWWSQSQGSKSWGEPVPSGPHGYCASSSL